MTITVPSLLAKPCIVFQHMLQLLRLFCLKQSSKREVVSHMKPFEIHSEHDPETWLRLWDSKIVEFTSKNKGAYSGERCFFGTHEKNQLMVFFHSDYDTVYLSTRFTGTIKPEGTGSKISGVIGKMKSAIFFLSFASFTKIQAAAQKSRSLPLHRRKRASLPAFSAGRPLKRMQRWILMMGSRLSRGPIFFT